MSGLLGRRWGEAPLIQQERSEDPRGIAIYARDLSAVVDTAVLAPRQGALPGIDGDELSALDLEIALAGDVVHTGQPAAVADVEDHRAAGRLGGIDRREDAVIQEEPAGQVHAWRGIEPGAHDLAPAI